jgi:protein-S-isoprenylcysteine O-methyltransferase Ste14
MPSDRAEIAWPLQLPPLVFLGPLVGGVLVDLNFPIKLLPVDWPTLVIGLPFLAAGLVLGSWGFWVLARAGTTVDPRHSTSTIVTAGPFRITRNPLYLSLALAYLGVTIATNALLPLVLFPCVITVITIGVVGPEERYLERKFPGEFQRYRGRVRRWG